MGQETPSDGNYSLVSLVSGSKERNDCGSTVHQSNPRCGAGSRETAAHRHGVDANAKLQAVTALEQFSELGEAENMDHPYRFLALTFINGALTLFRAIVDQNVHPNRQE